MAHKSIEKHHGVLVNISGNGVLIIGDAGVGKSSLALELLYQGHQLIADDYIEFSKSSNKVIGTCPKLLENTLHTRELGLIAISETFGPQAWQLSHPIDYVISLKERYANHEIQLIPERISYPILGVQLPLLQLSTQCPASLTHRIDCWLSMQKNNHNQPEVQFQEQHRQMMASTSQYPWEHLWP